MPRGGHKVKPVKVAPVEASTPVQVPAPSSAATKPTRTNLDWRTAISAPNFLARTSSEPKAADLPPNLPIIVRESSRSRDVSLDVQTRKPDLREDFVDAGGDSGSNDGRDVVPRSLSEEAECSVQPMPSRPSSAQSVGQEDAVDGVVDTFEYLTVDEAQSNGSSLYSRDSSSIYSRDSTSIYSSASSIYSSASSIYSSGASIYSVEECGSDEFDRYGGRLSAERIARDPDGSYDSRLPGGLQYQQRVRPAPGRRQESQDAASRERSTLAKKAALFKNSRMPPQLPSFNTSLSTWSMVCRAVQASQDCYDSQALSRRGTYTPADSSKDIKAMLIDDQLIDDSRLLIVSIRGTQCQCLADWAVNKAANPVKPTGFLDDEENACHAGFLQVSKAMISQVATQLQQHPASSERPSLLFTGHSAGGAVAAMLYSHMLSTTVNSELTELAKLFPNIHCVTFGAPPLSITPLPNRNHGSGVFLTFANEGDPILRLSNAAYLKSLAKLITASPPPSATTALAPPPVKVVRGSRGATVYRQSIAVVPVTPWEELPLWPTPPAPLTNAGLVVLLRDKENGSATASQVKAEEMSDVIFGDLAQHTVEMYIRRVKELALGAMMGMNVS